MNIILMGPPGAGKGTQSEKILSYCDIPHISTGDMFREAIKNQTELGKLAQSYTNAGKLVPDEVTIALVKERLSRDDCKNGYLLDGFPRTLVQADALKKLTKEINRELTSVINLDVDESKLIERIISRRVCPSCGASYNINTKKPSKEGICDSCGHELIQRKDDTKESFVTRLNAYNNQTKPLIEYYNANGLLKSVNGLNDIDVVFADIEKILG